MLLSGRKKCLFCVASPDFVKSKSIKVVQVFLKLEFVNSHVKAALSFWKKSIGKQFLCAD
jgi:hypothetical protein